MKLYPIPGIIAFIYKDPISGENVELPVTSDDAFDAELTYDEIQESFENDEDASKNTNSVEDHQTPTLVQRNSKPL